ncbi:MAG: DNA repair protein RadA [Actinomycetes bacterium]
MAKAGPKYSCSSCGATALRWEGRCSKCGEFGTVAEIPEAAPSVGLKSSTTGRAPSKGARQVSEVTSSASPPRMKSGIAEFDRVVGGGLVRGQVLLLAGEPGAGKSTLLLTVADSIAQRTGKPTLYISAEESVEQIAVRARRIGASSEHLLLADDNDLAVVIGHLDHHGPDIPLVIIDSVQTVASADIEGRAGGVTQVMEVAQALTRVAKSRGIAICLVGQVTKDSTIAGPRSLEHIVDTTLSLDGDRHTSLRLLRAIKNRYGPADEVACFEQTDTGMREVPDPSALFRGHRDAPVPGTCVTVTIEGRRPLLAEIQALIAPTTNPNPRRGVSGLDTSRVAMLTAVTERAAGLKLYDKDVYVATVGGMRLSDPGSDLAICLAIASGARDQALPADMTAIGEVTLSGDIRAVPMISQRIAEASRLGYSRILVPQGTRERLDAKVSGIIEVGTLSAALASR